MDTISDGLEIAAPRSGRRLRVDRFIGEGSQGAVHHVTDIGSGECFALKWYFPNTGTPGQRRAIAELIERGTPAPEFLWPLELIDGPDGTFGYLMDLRPEHYASLADLLTGRVDIPFSTVCTLALELAASFLALHSEGLCYRDISFGNIFFESATGHPLICDNDNVGIDGESPSAVLGTRRFMAPEIVRREAGPSTQTDLYSLAVLLFYLLMIGHPLVGRRERDFPTWDDDAESILFGREPLFVFHPEDRSNAPDVDLHAGVVANWDLYPAFVRALFVRAFTVGLEDPVDGRVRESVWRAAFARLRDLVLRCPNCQKENFWSPDEPGSCWFCERALRAPPRLQIGGRILVLNEDTVVYRHHTRTDYDFETALAKVARHPSHPDRWGLRNEGGSGWAVKTPDGDVFDAEPGQTVGLLEGTTLVIDGATARIVR